MSQGASSDRQGSGAGSAISPLLDSITCELIGQCLDVLAEGGEVWPTISYCNPAGEGACLSFDDDGLEDCLAAARAKISELGPDISCYALAFEGFVQDEEMGTAQDALIVEFGERGADTAYSAYIPYRTGRTPEEFVSGEPLAAGEEPLLFT